MASATVELRSKNKGEGIKKLAKNTQPAGTKIGFIAGLGAHPNGGGATISEIAAYNEFGTDTIPERPFLRTTIRDNRTPYLDMIGRLQKSMLNGDMNAHQAIGVMGEKAVLDVQAKIVEVSDPPNAELTIENKGFDNPLIATGIMRKSVTYAEGER